MVSEYLVFENPESFAIMLGILILVIVFYVLSRFNMNRASSLLIAIVLSLIVTWTLYRNRFYGWEATLAILIYILVAIIILRILWGFVRYFVRSTRRKG